MTKEPEVSTEDQAGIFQRGGIFPGPPRRCPSCGNPVPKVVVDGGGVHFRCRNCGTATYVERGCLWTVHDPNNTLQAG